MWPDLILKTLEGAGFAACFVGGCVRDTLLGRPVHDWDITTSALPEEIMALFPRCIPTGIKHGTVTVLLRGESFEVTTFRRDGAYHDGRHPDDVVFVPDLEEDLARRDFTINAMAMHLDGSITDCFNGKADLKRGIIRCVGDPERRFREDALRMLRAWRFSAQLGFQIEDDTARAIRENAGLCRLLSRERVCAEAEKTLLSPRPETLSVMLREGLLAACRIDGDYELHALKTVPAEPDVRWAMLKVLVPALDLQQFRLPSRRVQLAETAAAAYRPSYTREALKELIAASGEDAARVCAKLSAQEALLEKILQSGECVSLRSLAVNGRDFPALHGRAAGDMLRRLLDHVLLFPKDNNRQTLLRLAEEWSGNSDADGHKDVGDVKRQQKDTL